MRGVITATMGLFLLLCTATFGATITLPGFYDMSPQDIMVLTDETPPRVIVYELGPLVGNDIDLAVRYLNLNALNTAFGDTVVFGEFGIYHQEEFITGADNITSGLFAELVANVESYIDPNGILDLRLVHTEGTDPVALYRPWLFITDDIVPAATEDLAVINSYPIMLRLEWTAPGDDSTTGRAAIYEIRYSKWPVGPDTTEWWNYAEQAAGVPYPEDPGTVQNFMVPELDTVSTYYFILVTYDEVGNSSGYSNVASGTTGQGGGPVINHCLEYNGFSSFAQVPYNPVLNPSQQITVEAWYKTRPEYVYLQQCIIDKPYYAYQEPHYQYLLAPYMLDPNGTPNFFAQLAVNNNFNAIHIIDVASYGEWWHVAMTYDGEYTRIYFNAVPAFERYNPGTIAGYETDIMLGRVTNNPLWHFNGWIDEVRIWDVARTQQQIADNMNQPLNGNEPGLIAYWPFDEGEGQIFNDLTIHGSFGHLGNNPDPDQNDPIWVESDAPVQYGGATGNDNNMADNIPKSFDLIQNYPNPFNTETIIAFELPEASNVTLEVYDMLGRRVATLADDFYPSGSYEITWNGRSAYDEELSSGVYFYKIKTRSFEQTKKMLMLK
jgi:hypothetical protein